MASASRSRTRVAIGESENVGWAGVLSNDDDGELTKKVPVLLAEVIVVERLEVKGRWKKDPDPVECAEGCDGDEEADNDGWLDTCKLLSCSPLSDVAVVRLVPDPLRIRENCRISRAFDGSAWGISMGSDLPHSVPLAAACAKICRRNFLLFSNCKRAVSCSVSRVLKLKGNSGKDRAD
jgi:hypothetical protein